MCKENRLQRSAVSHPLHSTGPPPPPPNIQGPNRSRPPLAVAASPSPLPGTSLSPSPPPPSPAPPPRRRRRVPDSCPQTPARRRLGLLPPRSPTRPSCAPARRPLRGPVFGPDLSAAKLPPLLLRPAAQPLRAQEERELHAGCGGEGGKQPPGHLTRTSRRASRRACPGSNAAPTTVASLESTGSTQSPPNGSRDSAPPNVRRDILGLDLDNSAPSSSSGKRPMRRDAAKAAKKLKAASASSEYVSKMHDLSVQKIELFKETEGERKAWLDEIVTLEKVKLEEAREHRKMMIDIERERLALDKQRLQMEAEKKEKEEDERILAINLDQCQPMQRLYYQVLQEDILQKLMMSRRHGPIQ